ncbi:hypothetical protein AcV7_010121 [Taiwanofungus camphoratus]|nr:hypothetical protein AcV7_010121 [Antrodia cinnamomea]
MTRPGGDVRLDNYSIRRSRAIYRPENWPYELVPHSSESTSFRLHEDSVPFTTCKQHYTFQSQTCLAGSVPKGVMSEDCEQVMLYLSCRSK